MNFLISIDIMVIDLILVNHNFAFASFDGALGAQSDVVRWFGSDHFARNDSWVCQCPAFASSSRRSQSARDAAS